MDETRNVVEEDMMGMKKQETYKIWFVFLAVTLKNQRLCVMREIPGISAKAEECLTRHWKTFFYLLSGRQEGRN
jgi:hypothetical protein